MGAAQQFLESVLFLLSFWPPKNQSDPLLQALLQTNLQEMIFISLF